MSGSNQQAVEALRCSLLGDAFAVAPLGWLLRNLFVASRCAAGRYSGEELARPLKCKDLLDESVEFAKEPVQERSESRVLIQLFQSVGGRGGSDVRLDVGVPFRPKAWPRASIDPSLWKWNIILSYPWGPSALGSRINALELRAATATVRWRTRSASFRCVRFLHLVDSQVVAAILIRGRTISHKRRKLAKQYCATLLASDLCPLIGYVNAKLNPADHPSRSTLAKKAPSKSMPCDSVDQVLADFVECCWAELEPCYVPVNAAAGLQWFLPSLKGSLDQSWSLIRAWGRQVPPSRATPFTAQLSLAPLLR
ncbi:unnamed protein product [Prorocentrum cordatum]|uniref:Uncharacterized protein n=1 Tax=Prorocentrum cordatum TaxID=2364126 RepID=A0ABN9WF78_9DINO|nr:unnamed protein product [Polarella glacialis]